MELRDYESSDEFQSTLPHGSDKLLASNIIKRIIFQSTLPHGSDSKSILIIGNILNFNPRSLTGATLCLAEVI